MYFVHLTTVKLLQNSVMPSTSCCFVVGLFGDASDVFFQLVPEVLYGVAIWRFSSSSPPVYPSTY